MQQQQKKFYVTTPIYYVTARPHLGSLYSTLLADVASRWHKLRGYKTHFLTGTDEHGQKIAEAAQKAHKQPKEFVDSFIPAYKEMWDKYEIKYDHFIRTTDESHVKAVQLWIKQLIDSGDIYKAFYSGYYCTPCETYVTEKDEKQSNQEIPLCISCGRITALLSEESYFFKLSAYQERLLRFYEEHPDFIIPAERQNEVVSFVKSGLKDLSISRTTITWGIPFPGDSAHVTYVWADALTNYITALGYLNDARKEEFEFWWPADLQIMGKDIVRFHAVYWPAFLMASNLALPHHLLVHGWLKVNNQKMSKSFGNAIDPQTLLDAYGADAVRYYLIRYMAITQDSEFSTLDLEQRANADLANDLGNLLNRMVTLAEKKGIYEITHPATWSAKEVDLRDKFWTMLELYKTDMEKGYYYRAVATLWNFIHDINAYFHASEPWKVNDAERFNEILSATCHSLHAVALLAAPIMPSKMEQLIKSLGVNFAMHTDAIHELEENPWTRTYMLHKIPNLFQKFEPAEAPAASQQTEKPATPAVSIDDAMKVELIVGTIEQAEEVAGSDKLLKLQVNFGEPTLRQILSGVKKSLSPSDLIGKQAVFIGNLPPRKMMGLESQGMMLSVTDENQKLAIVSPAVPVPNGSKLK